MEVLFESACNHNVVETIAFVFTDKSNDFHPKIKDEKHALFEMNLSFEPRHPESPIKSP